MIELYVYSTKMSPENQGVFQLLKEVIFRRILAFYNLRKWSCFFHVLNQFYQKKLPILNQGIFLDKKITNSKSRDFP